MRKMSTYTVANLPRISSKELSSLLLAQHQKLPEPSKIAVIDVRDAGMDKLFSLNTHLGCAFYA